MPGTWERLDVGDVLLSPTRMITNEVRETLVGLGGYTHPLFGAGGPLPGQALLLLAGGLVEQTGAFDSSVTALVGLDAVRFHSPAGAGTEVHVLVTVSGKEPTAGGAHGILMLHWAIRAGDVLLAEAEARMLCRR